MHNWGATNQIYLQDPLDILDFDSNIYNFASFSDAEAGPKAKKQKEEEEEEEEDETCLCQNRLWQTRR
jgi:hypothetical protein